MAMLDWPIDRVIVEITDSGSFGPECEFVSFKRDDQLINQDQFSSNIFYGTVTVRDREGLCRRHHLVFKVKHQSLELRTLYKNDDQFHNEMLFYEQIMPFMLDLLPDGEGSAEDRVPPLCRYFYGRNECGDLASQDMVVLENVCIQGYRLSEERLHLDFGHLVVALRTLAKFHGLSYRAKIKDPVGFAELVSRVKETQLLDDEDWMIRGDSLVRLFSVTLDKLAERRGGDEDERTCRFRAEHLGNALQTLRQTMVPAEPLAVLCHGDFNRNNLLFLYDDDGQPVDALTFDLATLRYGSPALDLSFFLYMNTDSRTREAHWDELLDTYCATLAAAVSDVADAVHVPDREQLDAEMRVRAFYGLSHMTFFVRVMMADPSTVDESTQEFINADNEGVLRVLLSFGGEKATDVVADSVQHFINVSYSSGT